MKLPGHEHHKVSSTVYECFSFGWGELDFNGFWEHGCPECARHHEQQYPKDGDCWPHSKKFIERWKQLQTPTK